MVHKAMGLLFSSIANAESRITNQYPHKCVYSYEFMQFISNVVNTFKYFRA